MNTPEYKPSIFIKRAIWALVALLATALGTKYGNPQLLNDLQPYKAEIVMGVLSLVYWIDTKFGYLKAIKESKKQ